MSLGSESRDFQEILNSKLSSTNNFRFYKKSSSFTPSNELQPDHCPPQFRKKCSFQQSSLPVSDKFVLNRLSDDVYVLNNSLNCSF